MQHPHCSLRLLGISDRGPRRTETSEPKAPLHVLLRDPVFLAQHAQLSGSIQATESQCLPDSDLRRLQADLDLLLASARHRFTQCLEASGVARSAEQGLVCTGCPGLPTSKASFRRCASRAAASCASRAARSAASRSARARSASRRASSAASRSAAAAAAAASSAAAFSRSAAARRSKRSRSAASSASRSARSAASLASLCSSQQLCALYSIQGPSELKSGPGLSSSSRRSSSWPKLSGEARPCHKTREDPAGPGRRRSASALSASTRPRPARARTSGYDRPEIFNACN